MKHASPEQMRLGLRIHTIAFVVILVALVIINLWTGSPYWVQWVLLGWGIGLLSHWLSVRWHGAPKAGNL